jgi:hypothetical protein
VTLRYPATVEVKASLRQRLRLQRGGPAAEGGIAARRLIVRDGGPRPMFVGKTIHIPGRGSVLFK